MNKTREQCIGTLRYRERTKNPKDPTIEDVLNSYDKYQLEKLKFLNESYSSIRTQLSYWTLYEKNLHFYETIHNKDLQFFTTKELENLIQSAFGMDTTKASIGSFLAMYYRWSYKRGKIAINPYTGIKASELKSNSSYFLEKKLYGQEMFYDLCNKMAQHTKLPNIIPFILARYGIAGERLYHMRHLKWEDIDGDKLLVYIKDKDGNLLTTLDVDSAFMEWINKAKNYTETTQAELNQDGENVKKRNLVRYVDYGYVLKKALDIKNEDPSSDNKEDDEKESNKVNKFNTIYNRGNVACTAIGIKRIAFKDLVRTRQLELLLQIRKQRKLTSKDFEDIVDKFALEDKQTKIVSNRAFTLKKRYEELTGDTVIVDKKLMDYTFDENAEYIANKIIEEFKLDIIY